LVDRAADRAVSSSCFDSMASMAAGRERARQIRTAGTQQAKATVVEVREFELVLAHLRVPEMA
jgi:hypothetical protein